MELTYKWIALANRHYLMYLNKRLASYGLSGSQYLFILNICRQPGLTQDKLPDIIHINKSNVTRVPTCAGDHPGLGRLGDQPADGGREAHPAGPAQARGGLGPRVPQHRGLGARSSRQEVLGTAVAAHAVQGRYGAGPGRSSGFAPCTGLFPPCLSRSVPATSTCDRHEPCSLRGDMKEQRAARTIRPRRFLSGILPCPCVRSPL